ncbi:acyltransferase family protein [Methylotenera sp.]|uniref:acyltransferase family protein n=1 Tax=Methylotenera sp. TaxID=2051956 RepID=UPI00248844A0|nr:acyltransferase family protein [Methylotenera sp.]MDI1299025.1 acyltransferase family protein [Methylotenera sp.]
MTRQQARINDVSKMLSARNYQYSALASVIFIIGVSMTTAGMHRYAARLPLMFFVAMLLVFCFYTQRHFKAFFSNQVSRFLGEISFSLYLVHFQVLISLMSWLVIQDYTAKGSIDQMAFLGFACLTVIVSVLVAWCFRVIERQILKRADSLVLPILI